MVADAPQARQSDCGASHESHATSVPMAMSATSVPMAMGALRRETLVCGWGELLLRRRAAWLLQRSDRSASMGGPRKSDTYRRDALHCCGAPRPGRSCVDAAFAWRR
jgi:hypothetical protein